MPLPFGLTEPVLLVAGGHDQPCAALAIGGGDQTLPVSAGSYECAVLSTAQPLNTPDGFRYGLNSYCHVLPDRYATLAFFVSGMMVKWYLDTFCTELMQRTGPEIYARIWSGIEGWTYRDLFYPTYLRRDEPGMVGARGREDQRSDGKRDESGSI